MPNFKGSEVQFYHLPRGKEQIFGEQPEGLTRQNSKNSDNDKTFIGIYHIPSTGLSALYPLFNIDHKADGTISLYL